MKKNILTMVAMVTVAAVPVSCGELAFTNEEITLLNAPEVSSAAVRYNTKEDVLVDWDTFKMVRVDDTKAGQRVVGDNSNGNNNNGGNGNSNPSGPVVPINPYNPYNPYNPSPNPNPYNPNVQQPLTPSEKLGLIDQLVNLGQKVLDIVANNKPVVETAQKYAFAIPKVITNWEELAGWQAPKTVTYVVSAKQFIFRYNVLYLKYQVRFNYGGSYEGKGQFLTGVTVEPLELNVGWGETVNVSCEVPDSSVINVGTKDNPVAAMTLVVKVRLSNWTQSNELRRVFQIRGDGVFKDITE